MKIERITQYRVDGHCFESIAKAQDFIDGEVNKLLQNALLAKKNNLLTVADIVQLTDIILENRAMLVYLLSVELPDED